MVKEAFSHLFLSWEEGLLDHQQRAYSSRFYEKEAQTEKGKTAPSHLLTVNGK